MGFADLHLGCGFSLFMWAGWTKRGRAGEGHGDRSQNDDILDQAAPPWALAGASPEWRPRPPFSEPRAWEERGERGDSVPGTPGMGEGVEGGPPRAAMAAAIGARGDLGSGRESEGRQLGLVEEGTKVLTSRGIGLRWTSEGDRRWRSWLCSCSRNRGEGN